MCDNTKSALELNPLARKDELMTMHSSAPACAETPHATNSITNNTISDAVRRRAHSLINDRTIDANERVWIRYALETNDAPGLAEILRRVDAGEPIIDDSHG